MSQREVKDRSERPAQPTRGVRKLGAPLVVVVAFLALLGGYYFLYSKKSSSYLSGRNFRLLATMGRQVGTVVEANAKVLASLDENLPANENLRDAEKETGFIAGRLQSFRRLTRLHDLRDGGPDCQPHRERGLTFETLELAAGGYHLALHLEGSQHTLCASLPLDELLGPLLASREAFDPSHQPFEAVLLADAAGEVIYQNGPAEIKIHRLDRLLEAARPPQPKGVDKADGVASELDALMGSNRELEVQIAGRGFKLFVQPVSLPFGNDEQTGAQAGPHQVWLLGGLASSDEIAYQSLAIPLSYLAVAVAALLLALLSWPLLKFKLLGERQRVRLADMLMVAVCSQLGVSLLTLLLLDLQYHQELERLSDLQVQTLASRMAANLEAEVRRASYQLEALENAAAFKASLPESGNQLGAAPASPSCYPFWEDFALVDGQGSQLLKWSVDSFTFPLISVERRKYFKSALDGDLWRFPAGGTPGAPAGCTLAHDLPPGDVERFRLESVVSWTSGERQAVLARPVTEKLAEQLKQDLVGKYKVATLALPMLSTIGPVLPFGFEFAVIDPQGKVLFSSHAERNLSENLFEETDQDRSLRSAVLARRAATMDLSYEGEAFTARTEPVRGLPWTIVALRAKGPIEAANLESVLTAVVFLLFYAGAFALVLAGVALVRPGYRAGWLWPAPERANDYLRLGVVYLLLCFAFGLAVWQLPGGPQLVAVAWLLPVFALALGYFQLTRRRWQGWKKLLAVAPGFLLLGSLAAALLAPVDAGARPGALALLPMLVACFLVYVHPEGWARLTRRGRLPISLSFPALGLLLLLLIAVLPAVGLFKTAQTIQTDCLVKRGQLQLAMDLAARRTLAERTYSEERGRGKKELLSNPLTIACASGALKGDGELACRSDRSLDFYGQSFFETHLAPPLDGDGKGENQDALEAWPEFIHDLLPAYSSYTAETRELLHDRNAGGDWQWERNGGRLELRSASLAYKLVSTLPAIGLLAAAPPGAGRSGAAGWGAAALVAGQQVAIAMLLLALLWGLAYFISRHLFLVDLFEPLWSGREGELPATVGSNVFLVSRHQQWHIRDDDRSFFRLNCKDLEDEPPGWPARLQGVLRSPPDRNILLAGFEHRIFDPAFNDHKLALLEGLVKDRTVVVLSTVSPALLFAPQEAAGAAPPASPGTEERWWALLASFTLIDQDLRSGLEEATVTVDSLRRLRLLLRSGRPRSAAAAGDRFGSRLLNRECGNDPFLLQIGRELDPLAPYLDSRRLLEELGERAESYYRALWTSCSRDERVVLGHLAEDGLVNEKNRRLVRRLMVRGLILRQPAFRLMNETFRLFVVSPACRSEVLACEQAAAPSAWDRFRRPFFGVLVAGAVFFLATQRQLLDSTTAVVTAFTAGLPVLVKVADFLGGRRGGAAAK